MYLVGGALFCHDKGSCVGKSARVRYPLLQWKISVFLTERSDYDYIGETKLCINKFCDQKYLVQVLEVAGDLCQPFLKNLIM